MSLLNITFDLLKRIVLDCILLPDLIRFDIAVNSNKSVAEQLRMAYRDHHLSFKINPSILPVHLEKILLWMKDRSVYFEHLSIARTTFPSPQLGQFLAWTGSSIQSLSLPAAFINAAALFFSNLNKLVVYTKITNDQHLRAILS